jgi:para-nitrobenzyl esterase
MAPGCEQICNLPPGNCPVYGISEDCLYLSVYSPTEPSPDPAGYPVYFWIHGGAFEQGLGDCALYNGTTYAQNNIVSVTINYRLGAFGFLASESMDGNYGLWDQQLALKWTIDNIAGFGGNPNKVTIGGQSAGAMSVGAHLTAKGSAGMFQQAVMESNPLALPFHTRFELLSLTLRPSHPSSQRVCNCKC